MVLLAAIEQLMQVEGPNYEELMQAFDIYLMGAIWRTDEKNKRMRNIESYIPETLRNQPEIRKACDTFIKTTKTSRDLSPNIDALKNKSPDINDIQFSFK